MTLKRTTKSHQKNWLKKNKHLKILEGQNTKAGIMQSYA